MYLTISHFCIFYSLNENEIHICLQEVEVRLLYFFQILPIKLIKCINLFLINILQSTYSSKIDKTVNKQYVYSYHKLHYIFIFLVLIFFFCLNLHSQSKQVKALRNGLFQAFVPIAKGGQIDCFQ